MKLGIEQLVERLTSELGADAVSTDPGLLASRAVDGKKAKLLCRPASAAEVSAALRICAEAQAIVLSWGGGTAMALGNAPRRADVVMHLDRLDRVIEHDPANLTATLQSGLTLKAAQAALAAHKQFVPFDAPFPERATLGGIVAANLNGPRRSFYGSVRDLVIGMKVALANGELIKAGGKVVKNVAGYDMCKLFVGSLGTLGIITEVTVRVAPVAARAATLVVSGPLDQVRQFAEELFCSSLLPVAVTLINDRPLQNWRAAVWCEGFDETIERHRRELENLSDRVGASAEILLDEDHQLFWSGIRDFPLRPDCLVCRVTLPRAAMFEFIRKFQISGAPAVVADAAAGTLWFAYQPNKSAAKKFAELESVAQAQRGHAVLFAAPAELKQGIEVWGSSPRAISLMREIKRQFDPNELLNPGRFIGDL
jgi:glycolate oxidase FAD binding subunit